MEKGVLVKMGHEIVNPLVEKKYVILKSNAFMQTLAYRISKWFPCIIFSLSNRFVFGFI